MAAGPLHDQIVKASVNNPQPNLDPRVSTEDQKTNRLFTARRWINAHDADGAREIRDARSEIRQVDMHRRDLRPSSIRALIEANR